MLDRVRTHLTYANVMATVAVFIALGGSSYAAITVTGKNVKNSSLTGKDIKNSSLGSTDIKDRALLAKDFKSGQLPRGAAGPAGSTGATGPQGPIGPSTAYDDLRTNFQNIGDAIAGTVVGSRAVPAGTYVVNATVGVGDASASPTAMSCFTTGGTGGRTSEDAISPSTGANDYLDSLTVTAVHVLAAPGTISVACRTFNVGQTIDVGAASLTAIRVDARG